MDKFIENSHKSEPKKKKERRYQKHERETQKEYTRRMANQIEQTTDYETE